MVPKICSIPECDLKTHARGFCDRHYRHWLKDAPKEVLAPPILPTVHERFWAKVDKTGDCWEWTGSRYVYGHGQFSMGKRCTPAHRVSYEFAHGPIPRGLVIDHICHNPPCVNPAHLRAVTQKQNIENQRGAQIGSKSGVRGVWQMPSGRWGAGVTHHGVRIKLGSFDSLRDAESAVIAKRNELFTCNDADRRAKD